MKMTADSKDPSHSGLLILGRECAQLFVKAAENANADRTALENSTSRFKVWAGNIGIFASGRAGADWRFRDDEDSRDLLKSMLEKLKRQLENIVARGSSQEPETSSSLLVASYTTDDGTVSRRSESRDSSSVESFVELDTEFDDIDYNSEEDSIAGQGINKVIDMLYRFAKSVKKSRIETERSRVMSFKAKHIDPEEDQEFETFIRWLINRRLPNLSSTLNERLIGVALYRRWRLLYNQRHSEKERADMETWFVKRNAKPVLGEYAEGRQIFLSPELTRKAPFIVIEQPPLAEKEMQFAPMSTTEASVGKKLAVHSLKSAVTSVMTQSAVGRRNELDIPHLPKISVEKSEETICPYCCDILDKKVIGSRKANEELWRFVLPYKMLVISTNISQTPYYS